MHRVAVRLVALFAIIALVSASCSNGDQAPAQASGCIHSSDCDSPLKCIFQTCAKACIADGDCDPGMRCLNTTDDSACVAETTAACSGSTCPSGTTCAMGECRTSCGQSGDLPCLMGQACVGAVCVGMDASHDPMAVSAGGASGAGGNGGVGGVAGGGAGIGGVSGNAGTGGASGTGGVGGVGVGGGGSGGAAGKAGASGDAGASGTAGTGGASGAGGGGAAGASGVGGGGGGSSGASGASGSSGASGTAGSAGSTNGKMENCFNGIDDNADGLIDCADPECVGVAACALPIPVGFTGPVAAWIGDTAMAPSSCPAEYPTNLMTLYEGVSCDPAKCPCTCGSVSGAQCVNNTILYWYNGADCTGTSKLQGTIACGAPNLNGPTHLEVGGGPSLQGGTCTPTAGTKSTTTPTWATTALVCSAALLEGGCVAGTSCAPALKNGFAMCVFLQGDQACEPTGYATKHLLYQDASDNRGCGTCTCGGATGGSCSGTLETWTNGACTANGKVIDTNAGCTAVSNVAAVSMTTTKTKDSSCAPQVKSTGGCTEKDPVTLCCAE